MKNCVYCGALILADNGECKRCSEAMRQTAAEMLPPSSGTPRWVKVVKWLFIGLLAAVLIAAAVIAWVIKSLGPMPSFG